MTRLRYTALAFIVALFATFQAAEVSAQQNPTRGITVPIAGTIATGGTFEGTFNIRSFARQGDTIVAVGTLTGVLTQADGTTRNVVRAIRLPLDLVASAVQGGAQTACEILHLELGPLDLDLLGLQVHLDRVVLDIQAEPGAGNLLGNLLCSLANLLNPDPAGPLQQIVSLLNQILGLLG
jgi:hypothetical protein